MKLELIGSAVAAVALTISGAAQEDSGNEAGFQLATQIREAVVHPGQLESEVLEARAVGARIGSSLSPLTVHLEVTVEGDATVTISVTSGTTTVPVTPDGP